MSTQTANGSPQAARTRMGCDKPVPSGYAEYLMFQSTHPHGVRHLSTKVTGCGGKFQSTHPHGVRPVSLIINLRLTGFQSTHPHGVRPQKKLMN